MLPLDTSCFDLREDGFGRREGHVVVGAEREGTPRGTDYYYDEGVGLWIPADTTVPDERPEPPMSVRPLMRNVGEGEQCPLCGKVFHAE